MASIRDKTMPERDGRRSAPKVKSPDQTYEMWRRDMVFRIYGPQEPHVPATRRGRAT